ncbi:MAG: hypothetical protein ABIG32_01370 [Candidatus Uhrbacteria bacterium]
MSAERKVIPLFGTRLESADASAEFLRRWAHELGIHGRVSYVRLLQTSFRSAGTAFRAATAKHWKRHQVHLDPEPFYAEHRRLEREHAELIEVYDWFQASAIDVEDPSLDPPEPESFQFEELDEDEDTLH